MKMDNRRGLGEVRVDKFELIKQITENLAFHTEEFGEAILGWQEKFFKTIGELNAAMLEGQLDRAEEVAKRLRNLTKPQSHIEEYEEVLEMLEASQDEEFVLDASDFNKYWRDNWRWKDGFSTTNALYNN